VGGDPPARTHAPAAAGARGARQRPARAGPAHRRRRRGRCRARPRSVPRADVPDADDRSHQGREPRRGPARVRPLPSPARRRARRGPLTSHPDAAPEAAGERTAARRGGEGRGPRTDRRIARSSGPVGRTPVRGPAGVRGGGCRPLLRAGRGRDAPARPPRHIPVPGGPRPLGEREVVARPGGAAAGPASGGAPRRRHVEPPGAPTGTRPGGGVAVGDGRPTGGAPAGGGRGPAGGAVRAGRRVGTVALRRTPHRARGEPRPGRGRRGHVADGRLPRAGRPSAARGPGVRPPAPGHPVGRGRAGRSHRGTGTSRWPRARALADPHDRARRGQAARGAPPAATGAPRAVAAATGPHPHPRRLPGGRWRRLRRRTVGGDGLGGPAAGRARRGQTRAAAADASGRRDRGQPPARARGSARYPPWSSVWSSA
jgi:translation initiation factor IF-2